AHPYVGHKLLLIGIVLIRPLRLWLGVLLVALVSVEALVLHLTIAAVRPPPLEPWHTLLFSALAVGFMLMGEQRRLASLKLLRAQSESSALQRRAGLFLALCDQLNTPLQTLLLRLEMVVTSRQPVTVQVKERIALVHSLSGQLHELAAAVPGRLVRASLDPTELQDRRRN